MGRIAAANTAVADLESANLLNNAKVGTDALAEKVLAEEARAKEMNEYYLQSFSDSNALVYDNVAT
jgi:LPS O-antigen subunit length determinant protein (WzzB/FepE family)